MVDATLENPLITSIFSTDPSSGLLTYEQLRQRRAIAAALAAKSRDYPNMLGKGIFSAAESLSEAYKDKILDQQERAFRERSAKLARENADLGRVIPPPATPLTPGPAGGPAANPPIETAPRPPGGAALETDTNVADAGDNADLGRAGIVEALMRGQEQSRLAPQQAIRMASLPSMSTMSDAGQPGSTYGGPSPAGPGASMAEPPDQSPPAPSAPPPAPMGQGPAGTPAPPPMAGGGVAPPIDRSMLAQAALANQAFNPDATAGGAGGPPAGAPLTQLAQVGGFGAGPAGGFATPPTGAVAGQPTLTPAIPGSPGTPLPPEGIRSAIPPEYTPTTTGERNRQFGPPRPQPTAWDPSLLNAYNRALELSMRDDVTPQFAAQMKANADRIKAENDRRYQQEERITEQQNTQRSADIAAMEKDRLEQFRKRTDPTEIGKRNQAIIDNQVSMRAGGIPAEEVRKEMRAEQANTEKTAQVMQDYTAALDLLNKGVITGFGAGSRLDGTKFAAWLTQNKQLSERAGGTEEFRARMLKTVGELVREYKPVSTFELGLGMQQAGSINMEPSALKALISQQIQRGYQSLTKYDNKADMIFNNLGDDPISKDVGKRLAQNFQSPEANWYNTKDRHLQMFFDNVNGPNGQQVIADFDKRYGPGAAEFVMNRRRLNPAARLSPP